MAKDASYLANIKRQLQAGQRAWRRGDQILGAFGYQRRRQTAIDLINAEVESLGMFTQPAVTADMALDRYFVFNLADATPRVVETPPIEQEHSNQATGDPPEIPTEVIEAELKEPPPVDIADPADLSLAVRNLECATQMPLCMQMDCTIAKALTHMKLKDYSQLVVARGLRSIRGIVSHKSIAEAQLHGAPRKVSECLDESVPRVNLGEPLLEVISRFQRHDCVLVIADDKQLCGIVTPADIAREFSAMAGPFLVIGEIEVHLQWLVNRQLDLSQISLSQADAAYKKQPARAADLTMGDIQHLLQAPEHWKQVSINYDQAVFCQELNEVRVLP